MRLSLNIIAWVVTVIGVFLVQAAVGGSWQEVEDLVSHLFGMEIACVLIHALFILPVAMGLIGLAALFANRHKRTATAGDDGEREHTTTQSPVMNIVAWVLTVVGAYLGCAMLGMIAAWGGTGLQAVFAAFAGGFLGASPGAITGLFYGGRYEIWFRSAVVGAAVGLLLVALLNSPFHPNAGLLLAFPKFGFVCGLVGFVSGAVIGQICLRKKRTRKGPPITRSPTVALDGAGRVAMDVPCRTCGYNLRGLLPDDRCPECGTAVGQSIHGDRLCLTDSSRLKHLAAGALLMIISVLGFVVIAVFAMEVIPTYGELPLALLGTLAVSVFAVGLVGYWKLTMPDPVRAEQRPFFNIEHMIRLLALAAFVPTPFIVCPDRALQLLIPGILFLLFVLAGPVALFLLFIHMRRLALRIPNDSLARQTRIVMWGLIISSAAVIVALLADLAHTGPGLVTIGLTIASLAFLVFGIWWIALLFRYRSAFRQAARIASGTSPAAAPPGTTERPNQNGRP